VGARRIVATQKASRTIEAFHVQAIGDEETSGAVARREQSEGESLVVGNGSRKQRKVGEARAGADVVAQHAASLAGVEEGALVARQIEPVRAEPVLGNRELRLERRTLVAMD